MSSAARKEKMRMTSSSEDEDSDVERNFTLLSGRARGGAPEREEGSDEEEGDEGSGGDEEEGSKGGTLEEEEGAEVGEEEAVDGDEEEDDSEGDEDDDDDDDDEEIQTKDDIKKELSSMSFEDVMKLQKKLGTKVYNEMVYSSNKTKKKDKKKKRLNKNRPMEMSSKRPTSFLRQVVPIKKTVSRDPRFDDLSGEYKADIFENTYKFINDIKHREKEMVQKKLKKTKRNEQSKEKLQTLLKRMENQERARQSQQQQRERELALKRQQRALAGQGLQPFFLKKSDQRKLQLAEKYNKLKESGQLDKFLSKKRKRNAGKDRRRLPPPQQPPQAF